MWLNARRVTFAMIAVPASSGVLLGAPRSENSLQVSVAVDASVSYQTIDGFGTSERVFDDPHETNNFDRATQRV